jgi:hypothetical protein
MKTIKITFLAIILLASCSKESDDMATPASSNGIEKSQVARPRPFSAILIAIADPNSPPTPCSGDVPFAAPDFFLTGDVSHLGGINPQLSSLHHTACDVNVSTMLLTTSVSVDMLAANGDVLHATGNDVVNVAALLTQTGTTGSITGTWTINGGTGRFANATGSFSINGIVDFVTNSFSCECVGTITY